MLYSTVVSSTQHPRFALMQSTKTGQTAISKLQAFSIPITRPLMSFPDNMQINFNDHCDLNIQNG
jgi:hypothetical protein